MEGEDAPAGLTSLPIELATMIVNGRDRHGRAFLDPRWRCMARMACWFLCRIVENPTPRDYSALGDAQTIFRCAMTGAGDVYVDMDMPHARRGRWKRGAIVCASIVSEWLRTLTEPLSYGDMGALADRMVTEWGATRQAAHATLLAADRSDTVAYALDPATSAAFAPMPAIPAYPYDDTHLGDARWTPDGQMLAYAMMDMAVRRCSCAAVQAALAAIDAAPWVDHVDLTADGEDDDNEPGSVVRRGLCRLSLTDAVLAFDRVDVVATIWHGDTHIEYKDALYRGAARHAQQCLEKESISASRGSAASDLLDGVAQWARGGYYVRDMGLLPSAARALEVVPPGIIGTDQGRSILLMAISVNDIDAVVWALGALGHTRTTAEVLLGATGLTATGLMKHALQPCTHSAYKRRLRAGVGRYAGAARSAAWLCDILAYGPTDDDLRQLAAACVAHSGDGKPSCCVARAIFLLERWPRQMADTGAGIDLVRDAFVSCTGSGVFSRDAAILLDAVEAWADTTGIGHEDMREALALFCSMACRGGSSACVKGVASALYGLDWHRPCSSVCYGTCRATSPDPTAPFCNGRTRSDIDRIVAWCLPKFSADRWRL